MKKLLIVLILVLTIFQISCEKSDYKAYKQIQGEWIEGTDILDRENLYFGETDTLFYTTRVPWKSINYVCFEKFIYSLNNSHTKLYLRPVDNPEQQITCKIKLNEQGKELIIKGLMKSDPEGSQKFIRVER
jgi:hypothetical protein